MRHVKQHIAVPPAATARAPLARNALRLSQMLQGRLFVRTNNLTDV